MRVMGGLLFLWDIVLSFQNIVSVAASQKKTEFDTLRIENTLFMGRNGKLPPWCSSSSQGLHACLIYNFLANYAMIKAMT
jgi:hypothetical protein